MDDLPEPHRLVVELEERRKHLGITADAMRRRAGVSSSTHWGWMKNGAPPSVSTLDRCNRALDELAREAASSAET